MWRGLCTTRVRQRHRSYKCLPKIKQSHGAEILHHPRYRASFLELFTRIMAAPKIWKDTLWTPNMKTSCESMGPNRFPKSFTPPFLFKSHSSRPKCWKGLQDQFERKSMSDHIDDCWELHWPFFSTNYKRYSVVFEKHDKGFQRAGLAYVEQW